MASLHANMGTLKDNPCHEISLEVAKTVGVDFLFNVTINKEEKINGIFCGDLEKAHLEGCSKVAKWTTVAIDNHFDLIVTSGGGYSF